MTQTTDVPVVGSSGAPRMSYEDFLRHYEGSHKVEWLQQDPLPMLMTVLKAWNLV